MITKTNCIILVLPLMLVIVAGATRNNHPINKRNTITYSLNPNVRSSEMFRISRDTIHVSIEGSLYSALLIHDKYYAFYHVRDPMSTQPIRKFYIIEKNGKIEKEIKVPLGILKDTYPKLYYWHDHVMVNTEFYKSTYFFDPGKSEFVKNPEIINIPLFEDENCRITSVCHGEWGSQIYFNNKLTGTMQTANSGCPVVINKLGDNYFANTSGIPYDDIIEINDPLKSGTATTRTIFSCDFTSNFYIPTSFVSKGVLYHIYNSRNKEFGLNEKKERVIITKDSVKIGIIINGVFKPIFTLKDKFHIELQQQLSPDYQICTFHTEDRLQIGFKKDVPPYKEGKYGLIEISGNEIKIHYFVSI